MNIVRDDRYTRIDVCVWGFTFIYSAVAWYIWAPPKSFFWALFLWHHITGYICVTFFLKAKNIKNKTYKYRQTYMYG